MSKQYGDVRVELRDYVAEVEMQRPPHNYFDVDLIRSLGDAFEDLDSNRECRALVLAAAGKSFCAGANLPARGSGPADPQEMNPLYTEALRLFACRKPVVAAIQGAAVGGGLGVALVADFRVTCPEARFVANFTRLGFHPGFGLSHTLPALIGQQRAALMFYTGRRITGEQAVAWGLADELVERDGVRRQAHRLAAEIAAGAPLAVESVRETLRAGLHDKVRGATVREHQEQSWQRQTEDFREGVRAVNERRPGRFTGRR